MTENRFAMVSQWMTNGNINQFVTAHGNINRFELVSSLSGLPTVSGAFDSCVTPAVGGCREGAGPYTRPEDDPR